MPMAASRRTSVSFVLLLVALPLLAPAVAGAAPGRVVSSTATRAYLDRGAADGLVLGDTIEVRRGGEVAGRCVIEEVAEHVARCAGTGLRPGDRFEARAAPATAPAPQSGVVAPEDLAQRRAALVAAPVAKVGFVRPQTVPPALRLRLEAGLEHASWVATGASGYHGERVDLALRGLELAWGLRLHADLSVLQWISRPDTTRYRPGAGTQLFVYELALSSREVGQPFAFAAGRLIPWHVPGVTVYDGAQAAWRSFSGSFEIGAFGGELPDVRTIALQRAWLAGGYWAYQRMGAPGAALRYLRHEARAGVLDGADFDRRLEAEATLQAGLWHLADVALDAKLAHTDEGGAELAALRADLSGRPHDTLRFWGSFRYDGERSFELAAVDPHYRGSGRRADGAISWDPWPFLTLGASGGFAQEVGADRTRSFVGPELGLPRLFGTRGGLSLGYAEEFGWIAGRSAFVQASLHPAQRLQILARASYFADRPRDAARTDHELGVFGHASAAVLSWLSLRISLAARLGLGDPEGVPGGVTASLGLRGAL